MPETLSCLLEFKKIDILVAKVLINMEAVLILLELIFPEFHFATTPPHHFFLKCDTFRNRDNIILAKILAQGRWNMQGSTFT